MNMFKNLFYPKYYAARDIADFIKNRSLAHYLFHIQPYMRNNIWFPSCYSENDTIDKHQIGDLLILKLVDAFKKNNVKINSKDYIWHSFLIIQISIYIFNQLIHCYDTNYPTLFEVFVDKKFKVNYDSEIFYMGHNPFLNPEGNTFIYPEFDEIMVHFRSHFLQMHNDIEPANSVISLETVNKYQHRILQRKLIFLLINVINRTDFDYIVRIIEEETLKECQYNGALEDLSKIKPTQSNIHSGKIIPVK